MKYVFLISLLTIVCSSSSFAKEMIKRQPASEQQGILFLRTISDEDSPDLTQVISNMTKEIQTSCELDRNFSSGCHKIKTKLYGPHFSYDCYVKAISCKGNVCPQNWYFNQISYRCQDRPIEAWIGGNPRIRETN